MYVLVAACPGLSGVILGDDPLPLAIFELLEYIVNEVGYVHRREESLG